MENIKLKLHAKRSRARPLAKNTSQKLSVKSKENAVPVTRVSRLINYGSLVAGIGAGTVNQRIKKQLGLTSESSSDILSEANIDRIVETLCKVRGAALKLGQLFSIQDESFLPEQLHKALERVRSNADFMPQWQLQKVMTEELGSDWESLFKEFTMRPFAAASIGQVHEAVIGDGRTVAVKVQYPGVAESINADIDTLLSVLNFSRLLPQGMFLQEAADVARSELSWECDYIREAKMSNTFKDLLVDDHHLYVPQVIGDLSTSRVLTTELVEGVPLDELVHCDQETRNKVSLWNLELVLRELFQFQFMQTDPNWSNFLYDADTDQICLLDFGASREYPKTFIDAYIQVIHGASVGDRSRVESGLTKVGFQTGYESKAFITANADAVMILGEPFAKNEDFDFARQDIISRVRQIIPVMLRHRLAPPPQEAYSLHRKLSGAFLLCTKLRAKINVFDAFNDIYDAYQFEA